MRKMSASSVDRRGKGAGGWAVARRPVRSSPLGGNDFPPLAGLMARRRNSRHSLRSLWSNSRRQSVHEACWRTRAIKPASSGAPSLLALHSPPTRAFAETTVRSPDANPGCVGQTPDWHPGYENKPVAGRVRGAGLGAISEATKKIGFGGGVRSTLRRPTHRHCLTTANEVSGGSLAMHPRSRASSWSRPARADRLGMSPQLGPPDASCARNTS